MKAMMYTNYGPPEVLQLQEVEKPVPGDDEVLVKVHAASINFADSALVRGQPFLARLWSGFLGPKNKIPGSDMAGRVQAVGNRVTQFQPGDEVFGDLAAGGMGAFAEYVAAPEGALALKPANLSFEEAAAAAQAAVVALQGLRHKGRIEPGQKVLINGASGGIGTFAVQMANAFGAHVTGVCSTRNLDMVRSLGAEQVVDYTREDFAQSDQRYDLILSIAGNRSIFDYRRALSPNGTYVMVGGAMPQIFQALLLGPILSMAGSKQTRALSAQPDQADLIAVKELMEAGDVIPVIDRRYALSELPEAIRYYEKGHSRGKVVINVAQPENA